MNLCPILLKQYRFHCFLLLEGCGTLCLCIYIGLDLVMSVATKYITVFFLDFDCHLS